MALASILRNASRVQAGALPRFFFKPASVAVNRNFSSSLCPNYATFNKNSNLNLGLFVPHSKILIAPQARMMSGDHSRLWPIEKALSVSLLVLVPAAIASPHFILDNLLAVAAVAHFHWGLEAVVIDYARPIVVGNVLAKLALFLLYIISATTLGGLIYYNVNEDGIGQTIRQFWAIKGSGKEKTADSSGSEKK
ncbi:hypothetical protein Zmor_021533 [Zophobas morio]|uniref:Succinate dehydrogenase [ubiquinone] cytochrome b small subunit n=1 Tax=Zophobas morio TaxID=2755281 RepID=A0AA38I2W5_9CUCU|nr:hypothetical protein Zmor_021533 [Zophobas morio]